ncbi:hypothetical protein [Lutimonas sp.]|uniref:hypothetical protein n=1 Tax=Lutimonas sp. TaxID=1872403 RepID=UPI003D9B2BDC
MKKLVKINPRWLLLLVIMAVTQMSAQDIIDGEKMKFFENKVIVNNSPEEVWRILTAFGNVSSFHATIDDSFAINGSAEEAAVGSEREIQIPDGVNNIINKERIIHLIDGVYYTYEVYESENFPIKKMQVTFGLRRNFKGQTILYSKTYYKFNNAIASRLLKKKLNRANMDSLLAYKYFMENGEKNTEIKVLRKRYVESVKAGEDDDMISSISVN